MMNLIGWLLMGAVAGAWWVQLRKPSASDRADAKPTRPTVTAYAVAVLAGVLLGAAAWGASTWLRGAPS